MPAPPSARFCVDRRPQRGHEILPSRRRAAIRNLLRAVRVVHVEQATPGRERPSLRGCPDGPGFPSILIGRPSYDLPRSPVAMPPSVIAVAKKSGLPGSMSSCGRTYGTIFSGGWITQPRKPRESQRGPHHLDKIAAAERVVPLLDLVGDIPV